MPVDRLDPPTPIDSREEPSGDGSGDSGQPTNTRMLIATALIATILGACIATAMTLAVGNTGPEGDRGPVGERGPQGPRGPQGDLSGVQDRVSDLAASVAAIDAKVDRLASQTQGGGDVQTKIDRLDDRVSDLESFSSGLCDQLGVFC